MASLRDQETALQSNFDYAVLLSPVSAYLANNNSLSEEEINEVKAIKAGPVYDLQATNALIFDAQRALDSLLEKRIALQSTIDRCDSLLSLVRRVPVELWRDIFVHCLSTHRNPTISYSEAPLLLTHVCSLWRSIALTTPQLWTRIYIPIFYTVRDPIWALTPSHLDRPELSGIIADKMEYCCIIVQEWLSRAGSLSLSMSISTQSGEPLQQVHRQLLDIIIRFLDRCQHLELMLIMMGEAYDILLRVGAAQLSRLHELNVYSLRTNPPSWQESGLFTTPSLRKLSIGYLPLRGYSTGLVFRAPLNWRDLNYLFIGSSIPLGWIHQLLRHCPYLVDCNLKMKDGGVITDLDPIPLPDLRTLCVYQDCLNVDQLYSILGAPGLRTLECFEVKLLRNGSPPSILSLLPTITALQKLIINPRIFTKREIEECFTLASSIKHLVLGKANDVAPWTISYSDIDHLASLTTHHFSEFGIDAPRLLLPNLEILEAYGPPLTDKELLDFITKRLDPSVHLTSRLNSVIVTFGRVKQMDISRQVEYHADRVGVERFALELTHKKINLFQGLSPSLGLIDDRSLWK